MHSILKIIHINIVETEQTFQIDDLAIILQSRPSHVTVETVKMRYIDDTEKKT